MRLVATFGIIAAMFGMRAGWIRRFTVLSITEIVVCCIVYHGKLLCDNVLFITGNCYVRTFQLQSQ